MQNLNTLKHIAIIMDGNGRWAKAKGLPVSEGHKKGAECAKKIVEECLKKNIENLTLYTFSSENWNRPKEEVSALLNLLEHYLTHSVQELLVNGVQIKFIGDLKLFPESIQNKCAEIEKIENPDCRLKVNVALNYGSKQEIVNATKMAIKNDLEVTIENIEKYLYTTGIDDPDLLIRTGGEIRLSNFLLWQMAYSELYFTDKLWPDFGNDDLELAIEEFHKRERRFGAR